MALNRCSKKRTSLCYHLGPWKWENANMFEFEKELFLFRLWCFPIHFLFFESKVAILVGNSFHLQLHRKIWKYHPEIVVRKSTRKINFLYTYPETLLAVSSADFFTNYSLNYCHRIFTPEGKKLLFIDIISSFFL